MHNKLLHGNLPEREELPQKNEILTIAIWTIVLSALLLGLFMFQGCAYSATLDQWADNIAKTEGVHSHYGIKSVSFKNDLQARRICKRTVWHAWRDFKRAGGNITDKDAFIIFLANRYCPKSTDFIGNIRWKHNMIILMRVE